jgi:GNAT superfamily N-acetyltransferase
MVDPIVVRDRTETDMEQCVALAERVHEDDGYPFFLATDLRTFLITPDAYRAWVAVRAGVVLGHVALHPRSSEVVLALASETLRRPVDELAVVARLLVAPDARGSGAGRALLEVAAEDARARGLWPILDVATDLTAAIALYDASGWVCAGAVTVPLGPDLSLDELVYLGPGPGGAKTPSVRRRG